MKEPKLEDLSSETRYDKSLLAGIITEYEIPKNEISVGINEILYGIYHDERIWKIIEIYTEKANKPLLFGGIFVESDYGISYLALTLIHPKRMFLLQKDTTIWDPSLPGSDLRVQIQEIFEEGKYLFYIDKRSCHNPNKALLVANTIVEYAMAEIDSEPPWSHNPKISYEKIPKEFRKNFDMAIKVARECIGVQYLPNKS